MTVAETEMHVVPPAAVVTAGTAERLASRIVQLGAIAIVLVVSTHKVFELDRFLAPKELVLHLTAAIAGILALRAIGKIAFTRLDLFLLCYLALSGVSALFATNRWLGMRALAVSISAAVLFWVARALRDSGLGDRVLNGVALAVIVAAVTSLLQTYGLETDLFSMNRAPGGTLGNRNFVGHAAAFGLPVVLLMAFRASGFFRYFIRSIGVAIVGAALVLTRSRAAWLATAAVMFVFFAALFVSHALRRHTRMWSRTAGVIVIAACGVGLATTLPNTLHWRSDNPYLESVKGVAAFDEGSGRGRLIQYGHSLVMAAAHPLFGVGPGNWPVVYPQHAPRSDKSMNPSEPGMTFNPWPSSDWIAFVSERGLAAAIVLALVMMGIAANAVRRLAVAHYPDEALFATVLLATAAGAVLAGAFDAVLLLGLPALLVWTTLGALWTPAVRPDEPQRHMSRIVALLLIVLTAAGAVRSAGEVMAMDIFATTGSRSALSRAAAMAPGNYRLQLRLARMSGRRERCAHALAAHDLFPSAEAARSLARGCPE